MKSLVAVSLLWFLCSCINASEAAGGDDDVASLLAGFEGMRVTEAVSGDASAVPEGGPPVLSEDELAIQRFINREYDRDLVTRFMNVCPRTGRLAAAIGRTPATLSKLKRPEMYGDLRPSAEAMWRWLRESDVSGLIRSLRLSSEELSTMKDSLELIDLSDHNIVYDDLGEDIYSEGRSLASEAGAPRLIRDVVSDLRRMKGTFTHINVSRNLLSDEGLLVLVSELKEHEDLQEIDLRENMISDVGLRAAQELMRLPNLITLYLSGNYGPSADTIEHLVSWVPEENRAALRAKIK